MKLISCYISSFGRIKDFTFDFLKDINTIKQENGWGKSTLASFIKCMFYGLSHTTRTLDDNDRLRFKPWNTTEKFGGYIVFEKGGKQYKLQRFFGNKESEDTSSIIDIETGKTFSADDIGKRVFSIDQDGFLSTTFFSQRDFEAKSNSSLTSKFNEIYEMQDENTFEKSLVLLENKSKEYVKIGGKGIIPQTKNELFRIEGEISSLNQSSKTLKELKNNNESLALEISELTIKKEKLTKEYNKGLTESASLFKKETYSKKIQERESLQNSISLSQKVLNNNQEKTNEIVNIGKKIEEYRFNCSNRQFIANSINELKANRQNNQYSNPSILLFLIPILMFIASVGLIFVDTIIAFVLFALTICAFVLILFVYIKQKNNRMNKSGFEFIELKELELVKLNNYIFETEELLKKYFSFFNLENDIGFEDKYNSLKKSSDLYKQSVAELQKVQAEIFKLEQDKDIIDSSPSNIDINFLSKELKQCEISIKDRNETLNQNKIKIQRYEDDLEKLFDAENRKSELNEQLKNAQKDYDALIKTIEMFNLANDNMKKKYKSPLEESLNKYLALIDNAKFQAKIDINFKISIVEKSGEMSADYYSKGYQNLFEICKRFALIDVLFKDEKPFIILDDPFYNLDDEKIKNAISLLNKLKEEYQIIYFICHESRRA